MCVIERNHCGCNPDKAKNLRRVADMYLQWNRLIFHEFEEVICSTRYDMK